MPEKVVRVLDLCCGEGRVAIASAARLKGRKVEYTGIDNFRDVDRGRFLLNGLMRESRSYREVVREAFWHVDGSKIKDKQWLDEKVSDLEKRLSVEVRQETLAFHDPKKLALQLETLLGSKKFDEIHFHMQDPHTTGARNDEPLQVISRFLKPGGRFYHLFQFSSSVIATQFEPGTHDFDDEEAYKQNLTRVTEAAKNAGLVLDKYGRRGGTSWRTREGILLHEKTLNAFKNAGRKPEWTRQPSGDYLSKEGQAMVLFDTIGSKYSFYALDANHFIVFRKPKTAKGK